MLAGVDLDNSGLDREDLHLTRTSFSPIWGTGASVANLSPSKPVSSVTFHCFWVEGMMEILGLYDISNLLVSNSRLQVDQIDEYVSKLSQKERR